MSDAALYHVIRWSVEKLASNLYLSVHSLPQEGHDETDDASAGEV